MPSGTPVSHLESSLGWTGSLLMSKICRLPRLLSPGLQPWRKDTPPPVAPIIRPSATWILGVFVAGYSLGSHACIQLTTLGSAGSVTSTIFQPGPRKDPQYI